MGRLRTEHLHRWYEYGTGRYTRVDPLGLAGGTHLFAYARGNPLIYFDPVGEAYFAKRPLKHLPWLGPLSYNPVDDYLNTEVSHEQLFFEDGKLPSNTGFFKDGTVGPENSPQGYRCKSRKFNDCIMRKAVKQTPVQPYCALGKPGPTRKFNCQDWAERAREKYRQLEQDPKTREECGCE
jgi:uncharacterized protein RhaS with RHS repeats